MVVAATGFAMFAGGMFVAWMRCDVSSVSPYYPPMVDLVEIAHT
jgi:hypothetical protein